MQRLRYRTRRGATLIEFAMVVPVLLFLMLGVMEFGWYSKNQLAVANATREGARLASIGRVESIIKERIKNSAAPVVVVDDNIKLEYSTDSGNSYRNFPADNTLKSPAQNGVPSGSLIRITVIAPHKRLVNLAITPQNSTAKVSMIRERT